MARQYTILGGYSFVRTNPATGEDETLTGGQVIELDDDVAATHAHRLQALPDADPGEAGPAGDAQA